MSKLFLLLTVYLTIPFLSFSQNNTTILKGHVNTMDTSTKKVSPVLNAKVVLFFPNGSVKESISGLDGTYSFSVNHHAGKVQLFIELSKNTYSYDRKSYEKFVDTKVIKKFDIVSQDTIREDFLIKKEFSASTMPSITFKKNSTELVKDSGLAFLENMLWENRKMVIELGGHGDMLEKPGITEQRAATIKAELIKKGIEEKRIATKGYGATKLLIQNNTIKKIKSPSEKEKLQQQNRRVTFNIVSY